MALIGSQCYILITMVLKFIIASFKLILRKNITQFTISLLIPHSPNIFYLDVLCVVFAYCSGLKKKKKHSCSDQSIVGIMQSLTSTSLRCLCQILELVFILKEVFFNVMLISKVIYFHNAPAHTASVMVHTIHLN